MNSDHQPAPDHQNEPDPYEHISFELNASISDQEQNCRLGNKNNPCGNPLYDGDTKNDYTNNACNNNCSNNNNRGIYIMPVTSSINEQTKFANILYNPDCKTKDLELTDTRKKCFVEYRELENKI